MKKKELLITALQRIEQLEKIVKPDGITFTDPLNDKKSVFVGIKEGKFTTDSFNVIPGTPESIETSNITNQPI